VAGHPASRVTAHSWRLTPPCACNAEGVFIGERILFARLSEAPCPTSAHVTPGCQTEATCLAQACQTVRETLVIWTLLDTELRVSVLAASHRRRSTGRVTGSPSTAKTALALSRCSP
jgi:hypothetical protein